MYVLKFYAVDIHSALVRLLDRIRVSGAELVALDAERHQDHFAVIVRFRADNSDLVERLANQASRLAVVTAVSADCDRTSSCDLQTAGAVAARFDMLSA